MKPVFKLSRSNKIFFLIVFLGWLGILVINPPTAGFQTGERIGALAGLLLLPTIISWIVWLCSKRSATAASVSFNVMLGLSVLGQISNGIQSFNKRSQLESLLSEKGEMKTGMLEDMSNVEESDQNRRDYANSVTKTFSDLERRTTGDEAEFYRLMGELVQKNNAAEEQFTERLRAVEDPSILNFDSILADEDFERQSAVIKEYIEGIRIYQEHLDRMPGNMKKTLAPVAHTDLAKGALKGGLEKFENQKPHLNELIIAHNQYGTSLLDLLTFMQERKGFWSTTADGVEFENDEDSDSFNNFVDVILSAEEAINASSIKVIESM